MKPISFKEQNIIISEDQPQYTPLPAYLGEDGEAISCWKLTWKERLYVLFTGIIWSRILTFNHNLQPQILETTYPFEKVR